MPRVRKFRPIDLDLVVGPDAAHHVDRLVGELVALVEVDAQRRELGLEVAGRDAEDHAPAGEHVEAQHRLRGEERVAVREHEDVRLHAQPCRGRGRERQRDERIERVVAAAREPLDVGRGMVGDEARVEAGVLRGRRARHHRLAGDELLGAVDVVGGQPDREAHRRDPTNPSRIGTDCPH